jgi:FkbM family methyltransferase
MTLPVLGGPLRGQWLSANFSRHPQYLFGAYEPGVAALIAQQLRLGDVAYDVGANIGYFSMLMARIVGPGGHVLAFEPSPRSYRQLANNAERSAWPSLSTLQVALTDEVGTGPFSDFDYDVVSHLGDDSKTFLDADVVTVALDTVDHLIAEGRTPRPNFLKIDVEGAELKVINGMQQLLAKHRPVILVEIHSQAIEVAVSQRLAAAGYTNQMVGTGWPRHGLFRPRAGVPPN